MDATPGPAAGSLDEIFASNGVDRYACDREDVVIPRGARMLVRGWAANPYTDGPTRSFAALLDGMPIASRYGLPRDDVATVHGLSALVPTGYNIVVDTDALAVGRHELRIRTSEGPAPEQTRELAPQYFRISETPADRTFRMDVRGFFEIEVEHFHAMNRPPSLEARFERKFVAILRGKLRERKSGRAAHTLFGVVDGFDGAYGQLGYRTVPGGAPDGFMLCFPTEITYGEHELALVATAASGELERVATLPFSVTPVCCGVPAPADIDEPAEAAIEWVATRAGGPFRVDEIGYVRGYAIDPLDGDSVGAAYLRFEDGRETVLRTRQFRDDLHIERRTPGASFCGFVGAIAFSAFTPGSHTGRVVVETKDFCRRYATAATIAFEVA